MKRYADLSRRRATIVALSALIGTLLFTQVFSYFVSPKAPIQSPDVAIFMADAILSMAFTALFLWKNTAPATATQAR
ncbi:hypothetical protein [Novosphingobium mangrovi (ex Huang et al. 2023)]|uniref:Uncharacterized protein n=1 Tax=Novosphingobium mangrovi (ex Huang et al. 2023) TaxID=2976432 RepID=A0ABT2I1K5_9SPHN|nr:hypothetical protein [Novosphingobium mangrovi (ex Huang et al. 2023)]MCT2398693.1 hypothetical protein [Novosphingobium mangrovi (ex Huang et al. 2023)]